MAGETKERPHLLLDRSPETHSYTAHGGGPKTRPIERDRAEHAAFLRNELTAFRKRAETVTQDRVARGLPKDLSDVATFHMQVTKEVEPEKLEALRSDVRLLSVARESNGTVRVNVAFPKGKVDVFEKKIDRYLDPTKDGTRGFPKHSPLLNTIEAIQYATLTALWTDPVELPPAEIGEQLWWEVWSPANSAFREHGTQVGLDLRPHVVRFADREVHLCKATLDVMMDAVELLDSIAELRSARRIETRFFLDLAPSEQRRWTADFFDRVTEPDADCPVVCLVDTGVDSGHPLLKPFVESEQTYLPAWGTKDNHGHGTEMCGLAIYSDRLADLLGTSEHYEVTHKIESVKMLNEGSRQPDDDPELYGNVVRECVSRVEVDDPDRPRVVVTTITGPRSPDGAPTSWSAAIDALSAGSAEDGDEKKRLVVVSAGNSDRSAGYRYPDSNFDEPVQNPAQAWNALTVGAYTQLEHIDQQRYPDWRPVASVDDLSPSSTTCASTKKHAFDFAAT